MGAPAIRRKKIIKKKVTKKKATVKKQVQKITPAEIKIKAEKFSPRAKAYLENPEKLKKLVSKAKSKADRLDEADDRGPLDKVWTYLKAFFRILIAYIKGEYREIPWQSLILIVFAVAYFVSPIDLIPDWIPVVGYMDDAAVIGFAANAVKADLEKFLKWEKSKKA